MATPNSEAASKEVAQQSGTSIQHNNDLSSTSPCLAMASQTVPGSSPHNNGRRRPAREVLCAVFALCTKQDEFTHGHAPTERDKRPDNNTRDEYGLGGFAAPKAGG